MAVCHEAQGLAQLCMRHVSRWRSHQPLQFVQHLRRAMGAMHVQHASIRSECTQQMPLQMNVWMPMGQYESIRGRGGMDSEKRSSSNSGFCI
eukprot:CAMPEP_0174368368 /NCGR_PEP_ID=MMETSP0811_2-20130205/88804_1 /TAXON_ID=73025 ORGANISM="Eutreptiella gymnastica-like, Strain CCMP1594" /NCGR_SAMPLE_ID=MMETSP0811_2 /ASSEMBLY_ACC=CAM_ASM_000667 /LENGTH=91 /DNA_ID=CAMNT_0015511813 /DNA_START=211 /DNA_END=486 /DNA_ORIENTATION=-